ncbi:Nuclear cap-binding protein subunit 2 [Cucumispora dikerogammari]|nr:Nuclear cap-binding protein subunit 2 [Cucumispora dikerogammari]
MTSLIEEIFSAHRPKRLYIDRSFKGDADEFHAALAQSSTIWVGGLNKECPEDKIWGLFGTCGEIKRVIMGLNRCTLYQEGFCFIEYYQRKSALKAVNFERFYYSGKRLNVNLDHGFEEGRQFGRGFYGSLQKTDSNKRFKKTQQNDKL